MTEFIQLPDDWRTHDELAALLRDYATNDAADATEVVEGFLARHRVQAPGPASEPSEDWKVSMDRYLHKGICIGDDACPSCKPATPPQPDLKEPAETFNSAAENESGEPKPGDTVRVSFDAEYVELDWDGGHVLESGGWGWQAPPTATVEVVSPAPSRDATTQEWTPRKGDIVTGRLRDESGTHTGRYIGRRLDEPDYDDVAYVEDHGCHATGPAHVRFSTLRPATAQEAQR